MSNDFNTNDFNTNYCPYDILNIKYEACDEDIKKSFRKLIIKYHPDKYKGNNDKSIKIIESYNILICPLKRKKYDYDNNINNTKKKFKSFEEAIQHLFENASPDIFLRIGKIYNNITTCNEIKLCKSLYESLPKELQIKLGYIKKTNLYNDINGGLNILLEKYNNLYKDNSSCETNQNYNPTRECNPANKYDQIVIYKPSVNYNSPKFDYDITTINEGIIPINIFIDIKDKYDNEIKYILLKKHHIIIKIPIYCIKHSYKLYDIQESFNQIIEININTRDHNLYINNDNIIYKKNISLYEYYFECKYKIPLPNDQFIDVSETGIFKRKYKLLENKGMPISDYKRGNIIIFYNIILPKDINSMYKSIFEKVFPPIK